MNDVVGDAAISLVFEYTGTRESPYLKPYFVQLVDLPIRPFLLIPA